MAEGQNLPGETAFKLYDTYGFPLDLTQDALREKGHEVDTAGFDSAMQAQKTKARAAWAGSGEAADETVWFEIANTHGETDFLGFESENSEGQITALVKDGALVKSVGKDDNVNIVLNQTPFYGESGGQVGDSGMLLADGLRVEISDVKKKQGVFVHLAKVLEGKLSVGAAVELKVDAAKRGAIKANHSATHLLNEALRNTLGDHVAQRGSLNSDSGLRFDFTHEGVISKAAMQKIQTEVNRMISQNGTVETRIMTPDQARDLGAQALFGEKYGDEVRVVSMGTANDSGKGVAKDTYSLELCGGIHVDRLGAIGMFFMPSSASSVSAGVRRIEALTGQAALDHIEANFELLAKTADRMKSTPSQLPDRVAALLQDRKALQTEVENLRRQLAMAGSGKAKPEAKTIAGKAFLGQCLTGVSGKDLRGLIDEHKAKLGSGIVLLIADTGDRAAVAAGVTDDLKDQISAVDIVRIAAEKLGGKGGGGRPDMAQAGGASAENAEAAIAAVEQFLEK